MIGDTVELVAEVKAELGDEWYQLTPGERAEVRVATLDLYDPGPFRPHKFPTPEFSWQQNARLLK